MEVVSSWLGTFMLLVSGGGNVTNDLVSLIDADTYFKSRRIEANAGGLAELARKDPANAKAQISQLLALRWLGEHPDAVKKDPQIRALLQNVAEGKTAQDPLGFARHYARRALAQVDGKPVRFPPVPENTLRTDALKWFPADVTFFGALDFRASPGFKGPELKSKPALLARVIPAEAVEEMFKFAEEVGNFEAERLAFGISPDPNQQSATRNYIRITGRGDHQRLAAFLQRNIRGAVVKDEQPAQGAPITLISSEKEPPAFALIGNTDLVVAGYGRSQSRHLEVVQDVLEVRAGRKASLVVGPLANELKTISSSASGLVMGEVPEDLRKDLTRASPFKAIPFRIVADLTRGEDLVFRFRGAMASPAEAKAFTEAVAQVKKQAIEGLKQLPPPIKKKLQSVDLLTKIVEGVKMEAKDSSVAGGLEVTGTQLQGLQEVVEEVLTTIPRGGF
jgi:hypothetical protein